MIMVRQWLRGAREAPAVPFLQKGALSCSCSSWLLREIGLCCSVLHRRTKVLFYISICSRLFIAVAKTHVNMHQHRSSADVQDALCSTHFLLGAHLHATNISQKTKKSSPYWQINERKEDYLTDTLLKLQSFTILWIWNIRVEGFFDPLNKDD